jgi:hypothetical protein
MSKTPSPARQPERILPICWFPRDAYESAKAMMADPFRLYADYDEWLREAQKFEAEMRGQNVRVKRVRFHPAGFVLFCTGRNIVPDAAARQMWAVQEASKA